MTRWRKSEIETPHLCTAGYMLLLRHAGDSCMTEKEYPNFQTAQRLVMNAHPRDVWWFS